MYLLARQWGIQPSEFWEMTLGEWLLEAQSKSEQADAMPSQRGVLTPAEADRLSQMLEG